MMLSRAGIESIAIVILFTIPWAALGIQTYKINSVRAELQACQLSIKEQNQAIEATALKFNEELKKQKELSRKAQQESEAYQAKTENILEEPIPKGCQPAIKWAIGEANKIKATP